MTASSVLIVSSRSLMELSRLISVAVSSLRLSITATAVVLRGVRRGDQLELWAGQQNLVVLWVVGVRKGGGGLLCDTR